MSGAGGSRASVRCAIYTRKSTDEGLDQAFNTLDAQREAAEAYIKSQAGEGWRVVTSRYDDGGYSGGNMDRPALKRLLDDVKSGRVDTIVVYKVDRLTRSLMDFAKIVENLDARGVSFVSVTQAFNTTTSMGRLTLNVLLSFAQFERDVTGERIRDKVAASKAKGMWMGGNLALGYDLGDRELVVNEAEAAQVRHIFQRYVELGSVPHLAKELAQRGIRSKSWVSRSGKARGGATFGCGALYYLLRNRLYRGEIVHRGQVFPGNQEPLVPAELFAEVGRRLAENGSARREQPLQAEECRLLGRVHDCDGRAMRRSFSYGSSGKCYRYYVAEPEPGEGKNDRIRRVPASKLDQWVKEAASRICGVTSLSWSSVLEVVERVEVHRHSLHLLLNPASLGDPHEPTRAVAERLAGRVPDRRLIPEGAYLRMIDDRRAAFRGGKTQHGPVAQLQQDQRAERILREAHRLLEEHSMSPLDPESHLSATAPSFQRGRRTMVVGLLAPQIQRKILEQHPTWPAERLMSGDLPLAWVDQLAHLQPEERCKK